MSACLEDALCDVVRFLMMWQLQTLRGVVVGMQVVELPPLAVETPLLQVRLSRKVGKI